jgi:hypothetical protein
MSEPPQEEFANLGQAKFYAARRVGYRSKGPLKVMLMTFPAGRAKPLEIETLTEMVNDLRILADDIHARLADVSNALQNKSLRPDRA